MFAIVRTGGKQYRVSAGDKIAVEKLAGNAGDTIDLGDVILAGDGGELKDVAKIKVAAEIIAQAKSEKVTVFKKRRRHNYRRKAGHRQAADAAAHRPGRQFEDREGSGTEEGSRSQGRSAGEGRQGARG